jgi:raffinose/stachyose/melibiose transport system substrate-binding protein
MAAGLLPIRQWNDSKSGGGLAFPLQQLMAAYGPTQPINDWIFQKPGASIDTPTNLQAAQHLQRWIEAGYFPKDVNAIGYTDANARFGKGEGVFIFNGDWQNGGYNTDLPGKVGFFAFPSAQGGVAGMSSPLTFGIAANAAHADCAAFFFDWVATNDKARDINVQGFGSNPGGPADLAIPAVAEGSVTNQTLAAGAEVAKSDGLMDFIANATGAIFLGPEGWTPNLQKMVGGKVDAAGLLKAVQAEYEKELSEQQ